jgi:hypothetical protein
VRVLGEFPTSDDETVIPLELVLGAVGRNVSTLEYYPVWGVDVARFGDDRTALAKRQANKLLEIAELTSPTYAFTSTGKMVVESNADMKKRGLRSPDLADAFLLTFACGERKIERYRRPLRRRSGWAA